MELRALVHRNLTLKVLFDPVQLTSEQCLVDVPPAHRVDGLVALAVGHVVGGAVDVVDHPAVHGDAVLLGHVVSEADEAHGGEAAHRHGQVDAAPGNVLQVADVCKGCNLDHMEEKLL